MRSRAQLLICLRAWDLRSCKSRAICSGGLLASGAPAAHAASGRRSNSTSAAGAGAGSPIALSKLLVANRGEIACRVLATARRLGIPTVAVFSEADRRARHVSLADEAYCIGPAAARDSYLNADAVLAAARRAGADAIHPGYGFLSENAAFAEACAARGVKFVGPPAAAIRSMGDKAEAKAVMSAAGVPVVPGYHGDEQDEARLTREAEAVGFPLLVKAVSGGGGKGMKLARGRHELAAALASARREALASFNDDRLLLERFITRPRHVEVQVMADGHGGAVYLFDRDCSVQRRHQKVLEEAPAPGLAPEVHAHLGEAAVRAARAVGYVNAGTVEFIFDCDSGEFFFMEMNTRLQVEHPVTEAVAGLDLVELQLRVAAGEKLPVTQDQLRHPAGHALEARLYAESPFRGFLPGGGRVRRWRVPQGSGAFDFGDAVRVDSGVREGDEVGTHYDPMIAKVVVKAADRPAALAALRKALAETQVAGLPTNLVFLQRLAAHPAFEALELDTGFIERYRQQLLAPDTPPPEVAALAAVARCKLLAARASAAAAPHASPAAASGPWAAGDGKRLWVPLVQRFHLDAGEGEAPGGPAPAAAAPAAPPGARLELSVTCVSDSEFEVAGCGGDPISVTHAALHPDPGAAADTTAAGGGAAAGGASVAGDGSVAARVTAQIGGRLVAGDALLYRHLDQEVLVIWAGGHAHEFRWEAPSWTKDAAVGASTGAVRTPMPGKLVKLLVEEGQAVVAGQPLLVLESMKMETTLPSPRAGVVRGAGALHAGAQIQEGQVLLRVVADGEEADGAAAGAPAAAVG